MPGAILSYQQKDSVRLQSEINLNKLFPVPKERDRFNKKWNDFLDSDSCNKLIFKLKGGLLKYQSEQLVPTKVNNKPPLLLILGNPPSHSVKEGMFFFLEGDKKEHRFWKNILKSAGILNLSYDENLSINELNNHRKNQLLNLSYDSPFRIGLCVFISMPSAPSGKWQGVNGVHKLFGFKAMKELEKEESVRVIECSKQFLSPEGVAVAFQKNAWNALRSDKDPEYDIKLARAGELKGTLKKSHGIELLGVPPTRLAGPCSQILGQLTKL